jgi:hypothetical protein
MLDNILLVQEVIHSSREQREKGMVIKLDMENAFDRVRHNLFFSIWQDLDLSTDFLAWISSCIWDPWISPMINGRPTEFFRISIGLRQGFPFIPPPLHPDGRSIK